MQTLEHWLENNPFFADFDAGYRQLLAGCARNHRFDEGQLLFRAGEPATEFFFIREGRVALEMTAPGRGGVVVFDTLGKGDVVGASWLVPPYRWQFDARAIELTRAVGIDAACLRNKCETDYRFGYEMMKRFLPVVTSRLSETRPPSAEFFGKR